jgi:ABC-type lipoprotein export system ATPase subunit
MVSVHGLTYRYESGKTLLFPDFTVEKGKSCLLSGTSGSGKTTLLHLIGGLLKIQRGRIQVGELELSKISDTQVDRFRGRHIGFVFQRNHLISALSVKRNLLMAPFLADLPGDESRVEEVLAQLGLWDKKNARIHELSQGQAQRVAIARAILNKPSLILADEPTSALDDINCERVIRLLLNVSQQNQCTLLVATHDQRLRSIISRQVEIDSSDETITKPSNI